MTLRRFTIRSATGALVLGLLAPLTVAAGSAHAATPMVTLTIPDAPTTGWTVNGTGFQPSSWIWVTIQDQTNGTQPVDGPDAFQPDGAGSFVRRATTAMSCGHTFSALAFVNNAVAAQSTTVTPKCAPPPATADPNANTKTKAVYNQLKAAPTQASKKLYIGQALRGWDFDQPVDQPVTALTSAGLPAPKFIEVDLTDFGVTSPHDTELYNVLLGHAAKGGLVGLSLHANNPFTGGDVYDRNGVNLNQLADPAHPTTTAGTRWKAQLDKVAVIMQNLQANGAVVVFRPFHESNGDWFWWGQRDTASFKAAWKGTFNYLTTTKGLHNLLWSYSANRSYDTATDPTRLFPGNAYVDIVGLDIYDNDLKDADAGFKGYTAMKALGEPFAITEYGPSGWPTIENGAVQLPNNEVISRIKSQYPATVLASAWYSSGGDNWQISDKPSPASLLKDTWSVTR